MARIMLMFGGTGQTKENLEKFYESDPTQYPKDVVRVYLNGCQDPNISGQFFSILGMANPNLDVAAKNIRNCFTAPDQCLDIDALKKKFGNSVTIKGENLNKPVTVDDVTLMGLSRGAVTAFAAAKQLDSLNKPIDIYAEEPVPGDSEFFGSWLTTSELQKNRDLSFCNNIRSAEVIIGEFENIIQYALRKYSKQTNPSPFFLPFIDQFRQQVYDLVWEPHDRIFRLNSKIIEEINANVVSLEKNFKKIDLTTHYSELKQLLQHYLGNFHANPREFEHFLPLLPISDDSQLPAVLSKDWQNSMSSHSPRLSNRESTFLQPYSAPSDTEPSEDHSNQNEDEEADKRCVIDCLEKFVNDEIQRLTTVNFFGWLLPNPLTWIYPPIQTKIAEFQVQLAELKSLKQNSTIDSEKLESAVASLRATASFRRYFSWGKTPTKATQHLKSQLDQLKANIPAPSKLLSHKNN